MSVVMNFVVMLLAFTPAYILVSVGAPTWQLGIAAIFGLIVSIISTGLMIVYMIISNAGRILLSLLKWW